MRAAITLLLTVVASTAHAGYSCREIADTREGRRWFQTEPCGPGYVHDPLPEPPLIREAPRLPEGAGHGSDGSSWQVVGFNERGRTLGMWVPAGRAVPFVSTEAVRVTGGRGGWRRR
jgi:hypothetical protein